MATHKEIDEVFNLIDDLLLRGKFEEVDSILDSVDILNTDLDILLAYLTTTLAAKDILKSREKFLEKVEPLCLGEIVQ